MYLSDTDIEKAVKAGTITIKPFDRKRLQPATYDIRLGNAFQLSDIYATDFIDPQKRMYGKTREVKVKDGHEFILRPGISVLAASKEFFGSNDYLIQLSGKSSLARIGLMVHNTAGIINPGHFLNITLELTNQNTVPIILRPGMDIAQLTFSELTSPPEQSYKEVGRFAKDNWKHFAPAKRKNRRKKL
ncbi:MAG: dCTP deaminase [Parcubacteria group bacterium Gr01-1014_8]|nr:MAG: dCTP deaminase [Parcubacteria group bacterium Gr01-1014_8]